MEKIDIVNDEQLYEAIKAAIEHYEAKRTYNRVCTSNAVKDSIISYLRKHYTVVGDVW